MMNVCLYFFFFFQAEDGIRDVAVTGVQTCALPILLTRVVLAAVRAYAVDLSQIHQDTTSVKLTGDRKSTRLNSSHGYISYAVFCLKKKKHQTVSVLNLSFESSWSVTESLVTCAARH